MKKFIQIFLVILLVLVLFQAVIIKSTGPSAAMDSSPASHISASESTSTDGVQMAACLVRIKGVVCVKPNVGWNS